MFLVPLANKKSEHLCLFLSVYTYAKQKHPGCKKSARPIRSSPTYVRPKALTSAKAKKSFIKDISNYSDLNDLQ